MLRAAASAALAAAAAASFGTPPPSPLAAAAAAAAAASAAAALAPPSPLSIACNFTVSGESFNLAPFRGAVVRGVEAGGSEVRLSLCGDLAEPCVDALTKDHINGSVMLYFGTPRKPTCWDTIAQWEMFPPTAAPLGGGGSGGSACGLELRFSRPGDAHLDCPEVNVTISARCNASAPAEPKLARLSGAQDGCAWAFDVETANDAICAPRRQTTL